MEPSSLQPVLHWIAGHPAWSSVIVALITFFESLAIVGFFVPGVLFLFGIGALVAVGSLDLWLTLLSASAGAVIGDVISFWLGRYFKERLRTFWPFKRHPQLLIRGESFFARHGGKSVLLGRFVGPIRAIVPAIAGMVGMSAGRFITIDALSALLWAPAYIVPGIVFAASLGLAAAVATRLAVLLLVLALLLWCTVWLVRHVVSFLQPRANRLIMGILNWSRSHRLLGGMATAVLDPYQTETRGLVLFALVLMAFTIVLLTALAAVSSAVPDGGVDPAILNVMREFGTPLTDRLMSIASRFSSGVVNAAVITGVAAWWLWLRNWPAIVHWLSAVIFGVVLITVTHAYLALLLPLHKAAGLSAAGVLGHPAMAAVIYGFISVAVARELSSAWRWLPYLLASLIVLGVFLSRLYFETQGFSELAVILGVALLWLVILGVAYRRHNPPRMNVAGTVAAALAAFALSGTWYVARVGDEVHRQEAAAVRPVFTAARWWQDEWRSLPPLRVDFLGKLKQPFTVQWVSDADGLINALRREGWTRPPPLTASNALLWLKPHPGIEELPVLPQVHGGHYEKILLTRPVDKSGKQLVLRLWKADATLAGERPGVSLWVGYAAYQVIKEPLVFLSLSLPDKDFDEPLQRMKDYLKGWTWRWARRDADVVRGIGRSLQWNGEVLLIAPAVEGPRHEE